MVLERWERSALVVIVKVLISLECISLIYLDQFLNSIRPSAVPGTLELQGDEQQCQIVFYIPKSTASKPTNCLLSPPLFPVQQKLDKGSAFQNLFGLFR